MTQDRGSVAARFDETAPAYLGKYQDPASIFHLEKIRRLELLVECARALRPRAVLDAGSGPGVALAALREALPDTQLVGIDLSASMLRQAREAAAKDVPLARSLVEQLPFATDSFDLVYALGVFDYLQDPSEFIRSAQRVLKPGGHFAFTYPNGDSLNRALRTWSRSLRRSASHGVAANPITSSAVDRWLEQLGFELVDRRFITYGNGVAFLPWEAAMNRSMEGWLKESRLGRHLAWSCLCLARNTRSS